MQIVLCPSGSRGDIQPCIVLGQILRDGGHDVTYIVPPNFKSWIEELGFLCETAGSDSRKLIEENNDVISKSPLTKLHRQVDIFRREVQQQFQDFLRIKPRADLFIGAGLQTAASSWANKINKPYWSLLYTDVALPSNDHPPALIPIFNLPKIFNRGAWGLANGLLNLMVRKIINEERSKLSITPAKDVNACMLGDYSLLATEPSLRKSEGKNISFTQIGFLFYSESRSAHLLSEFIRSQLGTKKKKLFFGFGSMPDQSKEKTVQTILELGERLDFIPVIQRGWADFKNPGNESRCIWVDEMAHEILFSHVDGIVHHGGSGTTASALLAGKPQLIVPHILDQFFHGYMIHQYELGPKPVPKTRFYKSDLETSLKDLLTNSNYRIKAKEVQTKVKQTTQRQKNLILETIARKTNG